MSTTTTPIPSTPIPESNFTLSAPKKYLYAPNKENDELSLMNVLNENKNLAASSGGGKRMVNNALSSSSSPHDEDEVLKLLYETRANHSCMYSSLLFTGTCCAMSLMYMIYTHRNEKRIIRWVQNAIPTMSFSIVVPFCVYWVLCTQYINPRFMNQMNEERRERRNRQETQRKDFLASGGNKTQESI